MDVSVPSVQCNVLIYLDIEIMRILMERYLSRCNGIPKFQIMSRKYSPRHDENFNRVIGDILRIGIGTSYTYYPNW